MAKVNLATIKNWFKTGLTPTQAQFWDVWDSFRHKDDAVPAAEVGGLDALLQSKAEQTHTTDPNAHADIVATLRDEMTMAGVSAQLVDIVLPPEEVVDPASLSIIEKLNAWLTAPLVIQEDSLIYVRYWHSEISDGDEATIRTWALFLLEAGIYGPGGQPIPQVKVINDLSFGPDLEIGSRRVKLSTIPTLTQAGGSSIATQDQFNKRIEELLLTPQGEVSYAPSGAINGVNKFFSVTFTFSTGKSKVYLNGIRQRLGVGFDYTELDGSTIEFTTAPLAGDHIIIEN